VSWLKRSGGGPFDDLPPEEREVGERLVQLGDRVLKTWSACLEAYVRIAPGGGALGAADAAELRGHLVRLARCGRHLAVERELVDFAAGGELDLRSSRDLIRAMRHSIVLALSDDPDARAQAMSADEIKARALPVYEEWGAIMGRK
jgi:hypothetical protein